MFKSKHIEDEGPLKIKQKTQAGNEQKNIFVKENNFKKIHSRRWLS